MTFVCLSSHLSLIPQDGVNVPEILQSYMPPKYKTFIPFVNEAPIEVEASKKGQKSKKK